MKDFLNHGFIVLKEVLSFAQAGNLRQKIQNQIIKNAHDIEVNLSDYLYCTGRWGSPSKIISCVDKKIDFTIKQKLESLLDKKIEIEKSNVICKNNNIRDEVPLHQDISYSPKFPYHFSLWLALNDVDEQSGALQFIVGSHKWPIYPAVDFWSPSIRSNKTLEQKHQKNLQRIKLKQGDAVIFDSRLWHGSIKSFSGDDRYAYVSRWKIQGQLFCEIPRIQPAYFGMWNCHQITNDILRETLRLMNVNVKKDIDFIELLTLWQNLIKEHNLIVNIDQGKVITGLQNIKILHIATSKHNAGNLTGRIYKNLWFSLLEPLQKRFKQERQSYL